MFPAKCIINVILSCSHCFHWWSLTRCDQNVLIGKQTVHGFLLYRAYIFIIHVKHVIFIFHDSTCCTHATKSHVIAWFQPGMFSPGQHAPPPYPGQGQPSHLQPTTPMFVAPPPKTQRVLHSEAYLKYIEGLNSESNTVSKWDQMLKGGVSAPNFHLGRLCV